MGGGHDLEQALLARRLHRLHVVLEYALEGLLRLPLRVLGRERLHPIEREGDLDVDRLLGPQRAVVIESGDALRGGHEVRASLRSDARHEADDGLLRRAVVPGGEWIGGGRRRWREARCLHRRRLAAARRRDNQDAQKDDGKDSIFASGYSLRDGRTSVQERSGDTGSPLHS